VEQTIVRTFWRGEGRAGALQVAMYRQRRLSYKMIYAYQPLIKRLINGYTSTQGMALAKTIVLNQPTKPDYLAVPSAVFSNPELASVVSHAYIIVEHAISFALLCIPLNPPADSQGVRLL